MRSMSVAIMMSTPFSTATSPLIFDVPSRTSRYGVLLSAFRNRCWSLVRLRVPVLVPQHVVVVRPEKLPLSGELGGKGAEVDVVPVAVLGQAVIEVAPVYEYGHPCRRLGPVVIAIGFRR